MKVKAIICVACLIFSLASCENMFREDCGAKGYLRAAVSEEVTPPTTEEIQVRYYNFYSGEEYSEKMGEPDYFTANNHFLSRINTGEYKFLAYNTFNNKVRNVTELSGIEIFSDTVFSAKYGIHILANKQNLVLTDAKDGIILPEDTIFREFTLTPMVQKIVINITLKGLSEKHEITSLEAMLTGVITGRKIYTNQPIAEYAGLVFSFSATEIDNKFSSEAYVFGVSNAVDNTLRIECVGQSFKQYSQVDLSSVLKDFTADGMVIDLVVEIGENMNMNNIYIDKWQDIEQNDINFNK